MQNIFFLYIVFFLFISDLIRNIGVSPLNESRFYIFGVPGRDIALALMLIFFFFKINAIIEILGKKISIFLAAMYIFIILHVFLYFFNNNMLNINLLNYDIRTFLWLPGGIVFAFLLLQTSKIKIHLSMIVIILSLVIMFSSLLAEDLMVMNNMDIRRISHGNIFLASGILFVPLIILTNISSASFREKLIPGLSIAIFAYFVAVRSVTRSSFIITMLLILIFFISYAFDAKKKTFKRVNLKLFVFIIFLFILFYYLIGDDSYMAQRLLSAFNMDVIAEGSRMDELTCFIEDSSFSDLFWGRGIGGQISSPIYNGRLISVLHIGILNFWMKFGIIPFLLLLGLLFIYIPLKYLSALTQFKKQIFDNKNLAAFVSLSALFPWSVSLLMSGGYGEASIMSTGIVLYVYKYIDTHGIDPLLEKESQNI